MHPWSADDAPDSDRLRRIGAYGHPVACCGDAPTELVGTAGRGSADRQSTATAMNQPRAALSVSKYGCVRRLLLWDIDGTLVRGGGVGSEAIYRAAAAVSGASVVDGSVMMHGKTDQEILTEIFRAAEIADDAIPALLPAAMVEAERLMALAREDLRCRGEVIGGVVEALASLDAISGVRQTLVTGNLIGNAAVKLATFDLAAYFDAEVGAYGTDHPDREALVPIALERVGRLRGEHYEPHEVWVIGDTPRDLACAQAGGVRCLLVATGQISMAELVSLDADAVFEDLTATDAVVQILTS